MLQVWVRLFWIVLYKVQVFDQGEEHSVISVVSTTLCEEVYLDYQGLFCFRHDRERRTKERQSDDVSHRNLIRQSAEESWKRHAYRLAHPAYADGRVW